MPEIDELIKLLLDEPDVGDYSEPERELSVIPDLTPEELKAMDDMPFVEFGDPLDEVYDDSTEEDDDLPVYIWCGVKDGEVE